MTRREWLQSAVFAGSMSIALAPSLAHATDAPREVHGHSDAFAGHGIAIAWATLRGPTEDSTTVVLMIVADRARYERVAIDGVDPFGGPRQVRAPTTVLASGAKPIRIPIPRSRFADAPRSEIEFFAPGGSEPSVIVYYVGVPDTTPEFDEAAKLDDFLTARVGDLARKAGQP